MEKKEAARLLYMEGVTQREIAQMMRVAENTVSRWKQDGNWQGKKVSLDLLQDNSTQRIMELIDYQTRALDAMRKQFIEEYESGDLESLPLIQRGDIDALQKLFTTIKKDARKFSDYVVIIKEFFEYLQESNLDIAKELTINADQFLNEKRKKL